MKPFYCSLLFDGRTDKSLSEKEIIIIKYLDEGVPTIKLLSITEPESGKAEAVFEAIKAKAEDMDLSLGRSCIAMAAHGASVNFGSQSGMMV
ncbi:hypothetical protein HOLleu_17688 [Holothuria leucospilota]|uniref:Uncharacterized protein n=1 Tax=Holothuria leucospilota TaxID=206669 RepID=A0A9Q1H8Y0_HOLLE|nr:hypothetical protein HOLleu_17688 [Holothuria leucospilota]